MAVDGPVLLAARPARTWGADTLARWGASQDGQVARASGPGRQDGHIHRAPQRVDGFGIGRAGSLVICQAHRNCFESSYS